MSCSSGDCSYFSRRRSVYTLLSQHWDVIPKQPVICQNHQGRIQVPHWGGTSFPPFTHQVCPAARDFWFQSKFSGGFVKLFTWLPSYFAGKLNFHSTIMAWSQWSSLKAWAFLSLHWTKPIWETLEGLRYTLITLYSKYELKWWVQGQKYVRKYTITCNFF